MVLRSRGEGDAGCSGTLMQMDVDEGKHAIRAERTGNARGCARAERQGLSAVQVYFADVAQRRPRKVYASVGEISIAPAPCPTRCGPASQTERLFPVSYAPPTCRGHFRWHSTRSIPILGRCPVKRPRNSSDSPAYRTLADFSRLIRPRHLTRRPQLQSIQCRYLGVAWYPRKRASRRESSHQHLYTAAEPEENER